MVGSSEKGLTIARKVASRKVVSCCRDEESAYRRARKVASRDVVSSCRDEGLIDREKGGLERCGLLL